MQIKPFHDPETSTFTYVVFDEASKDAVIIDPVLDFDQASGAIEDRSVKSILALIRSENLTIRGILETHAHADHLSSAQLLKKIFPTALICIGERITEVQKVFKDILHLTYLKPDGSQFDKLLEDFEEVSFGTLKMKAIPTPGHTPACMSFLFEDAVFTGDAIFMPDSGTGRCDFPQGSARVLFESITSNLYSLPDSTRMFTGHDYAPGGREVRCVSTIGESKTSNIHLNSTTTAPDYIAFREKRDKGLKTPKLLYPSIQVNIHGGKLPPADESGTSYLKLPLKISCDQ